MEIHDKKKLTFLGKPKITANSKWWRCLERNKNEAGLKKIIGQAKFMLDQKKLEKLYDNED